MTHITQVDTPRDVYDARTPAGLQSTSALVKRRIFVMALNGVTIAALAYAFALVLGSNTWTWLDIGIYVSILIGLPWTVIGFWNAIIGLVLLHVAKDGVRLVAPHIRAGDRRRPLRQRAAILMTIRNEDPARAFKRLRIVRASLLATGEEAAFDYFILSDTSKPEVAAEEERLFAEWKAEAPDARVIYRRRLENKAYKVGNVRDFIDRWGANYEIMIPLDADSLMSGEAIVRLARIMQAYPRLGILQTLVVGAPSQSAFARIFQFGMRHGMRSYTMGAAWWAGDYGPYWGHNAAVRIKPFAEHCQLPVLPGKPPLGGHVLSHDHIEAAMMRRADYEVRVLPVEGGSYEDNPPTILDFTQRDLRWCQGVMQYWRLIGLPGLKPWSRFQIGFTILMYLGAAAWMAMIALFAAKAFESGFGNLHVELGMALFFGMFLMSLTPKIAGLIDIALTPGGMRRYGGAGRFTASAGLEILFSMLLSPIASLRVTIFMVSVLFGRAVIWSGQNRDAYGLSWATAMRGLWPQMLFGFVILGVLLAHAPGAIVWAMPLLAAFLLAAPFAVVTASPAFGEWLARAGLCAIPEEFDAPPEIASLGGPDMSGGALVGGVGERLAA
ncbi:MAG: glucans biosynthesis glucosyltransferase MdoH [Hyphomicrobiales bacterium]|nr:glucans biosynthesis glucosyltransferase MdoH [Hyphomicrobiales bacterium]